MPISPTAARGSLRRLLAGLDYAHAAAVLAPQPSGGADTHPGDAALPPVDTTALAGVLEGAARPPRPTLDPTLRRIVVDLVGSAPAPATEPLAPAAVTPIPAMPELDRARAAAQRYNGARHLRPEVIERIQEAVGVARTGRLGPTTLAALEVFQRRRGITPDGRVGPETLRHVMSELHARHGLRGQLTDGEREDAIDWTRGQRLDAALLRRLQARLGVRADGVFGPATAEAVARFQATHHLAASGRLGPTTIAALRATSDPRAGQGAGASGGRRLSLAAFASKDGAPTPTHVVPSLLALIDQLEILSAALGGATIRVSSGYRSPAHNRRVGGERNSRHLRGQAADITVGGKTPRQVKAVMERLIAQGRMRQGGVGLYAGFVHYDTRGYRARW